MKAEPGYPAGSSRGTSAGRGSSGHGRWGECAAARRRDRLTRCSPLSLQLSLHWGVEAERRNDMRGTVTLIGERLYSLYNPQDDLVWISAHQKPAGDSCVALPYIHGLTGLNRN